MMMLNPENRPITEANYYDQNCYYWFEEMVMAYRDVTVWKLHVDEEGLYRESPVNSYSKVRRNIKVQIAYQKWLQNKEIDKILLVKEES